MLLVPNNFARYGISKVFTHPAFVDAYVSPFVNPNKIPDVESPNTLNDVSGEQRKFSVGIAKRNRDVPYRSQIRHQSVGVVVAVRNVVRAERCV